MGNVICRTPKSTCLTLWLCIPCKETWLKPSQAVSRAGELSLNEQFMAPQANPGMLDQTEYSSRIHNPEWNLEVTKGPSYRDRYFHISVTLETNHSTLKLYIIMTVVTKARKKCEKVKASQHVCRITKRLFMHENFNHSYQ